MIGNLPISLEEIIYAAFLSLCLTLVIRNIYRAKKVIKNAKDFAKQNQSEIIANEIKRCYNLFPIDKIVFHGKTFTRGMTIKITTIANTKFEGEFIGGNDRNMLCIKTNRFIIAHELKNISDIDLIKESKI